MLVVISVVVLFPVDQVVAQDQGSIWTIVHQKHRHGHGQTPGLEHAKTQIVDAVAQQQQAGEKKRRLLQQEQVAQKHAVLGEAEDLVKILQAGDVSRAGVVEVDHKIKAIGHDLCKDKAILECVRFRASKGGGNMLDRLRGLMAHQHSAFGRPKMSQDFHSVQQDMGEVAEHDQGAAVRLQLASTILPTVVVAIVLAMQ